MKKFTYLLFIVACHHINAGMLNKSSDKIEQKLKENNNELILLPKDFEQLPKQTTHLETINTKEDYTNKILQSKGNTMIYISEKDNITVDKKNIEQELLLIANSFKSYIKIYCIKKDHFAEYTHNKVKNINYDLVFFNGGTIVYTTLTSNNFLEKLYMKLEETEEKTAQKKINNFYNILKSIDE